MSTINKQRALKIVLVLLGVSSIATASISLAYSYMDSDSDQVHPDQNQSLARNEKVNDIKLTNKEAIDALSSENIKLIKNKIVALEKKIEKQENLSTSLDYANLSLPNAEKYNKVNVIATGYTAGIESTGKDPSHPQYGITYSGVYVRRDVYSTIAADINVFPLGTVLFIPGYGYGVVTDTGSAIKGNKIDLYFETVEDVYSQWGKKNVDVYVIKRGDGVVNEEVLDQYNNKAELAKTAM